MERGYSTHSRHLMSDEFHREDQPVLTQLKKAYWTTKQQIRKTMGKKEDEHVVASDAELDAKLELFQQIKISCVDLLRVILLYQKRLIVLAREENSMGKFLKTQGDEDSTQAGKMMRAVGKSQGFTAQQRVQLRQPLYRVFQEVETFRQQAIKDTQITVNKMEEARTAYRAALLWMKDVSEQLDPDAYNRLEKFRKVQLQVKKAKEVFDKHKLDVLQKVDMLTASRSNMFSHALAAYQNSLLNFWRKTSKTMNAVSETFKGFQYYEFSMLKDELDDTARELAKQTASEKASELLDSILHDTGDQPKSEEDKLIYDIIMSLKEKDSNSNNQNSSDEQKPPVQKEAAERKNMLPHEGSADSTTGLIDFGDDCFNEEMTDEQFGEFQAAFDREAREVELVGNPIEDQYAPLSQENNEFLDDIFGTGINLQSNTEISPPASTNAAKAQDNSGGFLPADLLESDLSALQLHGATPIPPESDNHLLGKLQPPPYTPAAAAKPLQQLPAQPKTAASKQPLSSWYNLFADLDPLQDPDAIGRKDQGNSGCA